MNIPSCSGVIAADGSCSGTWSSVPYPIPFDVSQLEPAVLGEFFAAGFVFVGSVILTIFGFRQIYFILRGK